MISYNRLSLAEILTDCQGIFENDKPLFLSLLENNLDLGEFISVYFEYINTAPRLTGKRDSETHGITPEE